MQIPVSARGMINVPANELVTAEGPLTNVYDELAYLDRGGGISWPM